VRIKAYIFTAGPFIGFSVLSNGSNLPRVAGGPAWQPLHAAITEFAELAAYTADTAVARFNLRSRGYHFCRVPAEPAIAGSTGAAGMAPNLLDGN